MRARRLAVACAVAVPLLLPTTVRSLVIGNECRVERIGGDYVFSVLAPPEAASEMLGVPSEPVDIPEIDVWKTSGRDPGPVWGVEAQGSQMVRSLKYGEVPQGYQQFYPVRGKPDPLQVGEEYRITCGGEGRFRVTATGIQRLETARDLHLKGWQRATPRAPR